MSVRVFSNEVKSFPKCSKLDEKVSRESKKNRQVSLHLEVERAWARALGPGNRNWALQSYESKGQSNQDQNFERSTSYIPKLTSLDLNSRALA